MSWIAVAIVGGAAVGYLATDNASKRGATAMTDASNAANSTQLQMYNQTRDDQAPWRAAGAGALTGLQDTGFQKDFSMADFQKDPGYQFRLDEGNKAINASASARGMGNSGATMKALTRYGQDYATGEYQNAYNRYNNNLTTRYNRLSSLAGLGQTANSQVSNAGMNMANQTGQNGMSAANAQAAGQMASANALNSGIGTGTNAWMQYNMMNRMFPTSPAAPVAAATSGGYGSAGQSYANLGSLA